MKKVYSKSKQGICKVTFALPKGIGAETAHIVGEFNDWDQSATPMTRKKDGSFSVALHLEAGKQYRFRYWLDETRWENDSDSDGYVPNGFGSDDSIVKT